MNTLLGISSPYSTSADIVSKSVKAEDLKHKLENSEATDTELMEACKSFEAYMIEQVMKHMQKTIPNNGEKNIYLNYFGNMLNNEYANAATEKQELGIAQMLYDAMKRNS